MQYDPIQGQGHEPSKVGNSAVFKGYLLPHLQWGLANDHGTIPKAYRGRIFIFVLVFMSHDLGFGSK